MKHINGRGTRIHSPHPTLGKTAFLMTRTARIIHMCEQANKAPWAMATASRHRSSTKRSKQAMPTDTKKHSPPLPQPRLLRTSPSSMKQSFAITVGRPGGPKISHPAPSDTLVLLKIFHRSIRVMFIHVHVRRETLELRQKQNAESLPLPRAPDPTKPTKSPNHQLITFGSGALGSPTHATQEPENCLALPYCCN